MADVEKLKEKRRQLDARIQKIESLEKTKQRKEDTRRKIIVGGALLAFAAREPKFKENLYRHLEKLITNPKDRILIGLSMPQEQPPGATDTAAEEPIKSSSSGFDIKPDTPL